MAEKKTELGGKKLSLPTKVIIVVFAVIMALSMMLPSLAQFFASSGSESASEQTEQTTDASADEKSEGSEESGEGEDAEAAKDDAEPIGGAVPDNETLRNYYDTYSERVAGYEERLEADPNNLAALLNAGQAYMNWGYSADYVSMDEKEKAYSRGLVERAITYFDRYLELRDSKSVRVDRALCLYYADKTDEAIAELEAFSEKEPDYPLVWANLGMLYELTGETEKANAAYATAAETDADNKYGAKDYANERLIQLNSKVENPADAGEASANDISTQEESGLTSTLAKDSGVGF